MTSQPKKIVVLVDDEDDTRSPLENYLDVWGYDVHCFVDAQHYIQSNIPRPDCLILDLEMPGINGVKAIETLSRLGRLGPTIVLTDMRRADLLKAIEQSPAKLVLTKPIRSQDLARAVAALTGTKCGSAPVDMT